MRIGKVVFAVAAALAIGASPAAMAQITVNGPAERQLSGWLEATTKHFVLVGKVSEGELRRRAIRLERIHAALSTIAPATNDNRLLIYLTDGITQIQRMAHTDSIAGYYIPTAMGAFSVSPLTFAEQRQGWTPEVVLFHEYTHHMLLQTNGEYFPGWVSEGLAELFATAQIKDNGDVIIGRANEARAIGMGFEHLSRWSVERLLLSDKVKTSKDERIEKYTRGALLVHYLLLDPKRAPLFTKYIQAINAGTDPIEAGKATFGNLAALDRALDAYLKRSSVPSIVMAADNLRASIDVTVRPMRNDESEALPLRLESTTHESNKYAPGLVEPARRLAARYPGSATVLQTLAQIEYEAGNYAEAATAADRVLAIEPDNLMALLYKGRALGQAAIVSKLPADWSAARALFVKANRIDPNHPWPFVLLYDSYFAAGRTAPAAVVTGLRRAVVLAPQDPGVRVRMALQLIREGDLPGARTVIAPVAFNPEGNPDSPAANFYPVLAAGGETEALLAKATELKVPVNSFFPNKEEDEKQDRSKSGGGKSKS